MDDATPTAAAASHSIRGRFHFRRNSNPSPGPDRHSRDGGAKSLAPSDRQLLRASRAHHGRANRKGLGVGLGLSSLVPPFRGKSLLYLAILLAVFVFAMASMVLQSSITSVFKQGGARRGSVREGLKFGSTLKFVPSRQLAEGGGLDRARSERRIGVRPPRLALVLGNLRKDPQFLMLFSIVSNLKKLGYTFQIYAVEYGKALPVWKDVASQISVLGPEQYGHIDWSIYEGIIVDSIEAKEAVSSLMQEPFSSVPLVWVIQDDVLAKRIPFYEEMDWKHLVTLWRNTFSRADVIVFPDFTLPMLYSVLDTGNFFVIPGSPVDVWSAERYSQTHFKHQLRELNGFQRDDLVVLVIGSSLFYNELSWDYAVAMHAIGPLLVKYARRSDGGSYKFVFLCGNSTGDSDDAFQEIASRLGLLQGSVRHFGINADVDSVLTMADIVLYGSSQDEQGFPPLLVRSMTFGIPIVVPDIPVITKYVVDGVHGILFPQHNPDALMRAFSSLIADGGLSEFAITVASSGKLLAKNMMASECISTYVKLLENILDFPSDAILPGPVAKLEELSWNWNLLEGEINQDAVDMPHEDLTQAGVVYALEEELTDLVDLRNASENQTDTIGDFPTEEDWAVLQEIEQIEEFEKVEKEELEERMERDPGSWNDIYRNARKSEKLSFEANERDEGELERTGQPVCIYEIYEGAGAWSFLHHGSLYRGLSLSTKARRLRSDDVDAVSRLRLLNNTYYQDILCEMGGMFSIAKRVDNIHSRPWIGFQSWRTAGRKVSLSPKAEKVLEESVQGEEKGDVMYFWACLDMDGGVSGSNDVLTFWSMCDILNGGGCRNAFEQAFRKIYALPSHIEALPPMPEDGGYWSTLHSWVMPTPSFLEFIMFTRMFADSLDSLHINSSATNFCLLGETEAEKKHCYCRILELLVNVWAYHSARKMVYLDPHTGSLLEQHPLELRRGYMWAKYFNFTLLKSMDEDLAEAADDGDNPRDPWLWPLSGEVHWQGIYEREREERYRLKMDKKRKTREKLNERMKHGYKQKSLGG